MSMRRAAQAVRHQINTTAWSASYKSMGLGQLTAELARIATAPWDHEYEQRRVFILNELAIRTLRPERH